jgi:hypothetical protein
VPGHAPLAPRIVAQPVMPAPEERAYTIDDACGVSEFARSAPD